MIRQLPPFSKGDDPRKALNAEFLNELILSSRRANTLDSTGRTSGVGGTPPTTFVKVHNTGSSTLTFGQIVRITGLATPFETDSERFQFRQAPYFTIGTPTADDEQPLIINRPIDAGEIGLAAIAGIAVTVVDVSDSAHRFAVPVAATKDYLASAESGPVRILHKADPHDANKRWCVVLLVGGGGDGGAAGETFVADFVHVVGYSGGFMTCRRVTLDSPGAWPPVESSPVVEYEDVFESENREPRIIDTPGTATHIKPLYVDRDGNYFVDFWKVDTYDDIEIATGNFTVEEDPDTCEITITPEMETYRISLTVTPPGTAGTGLTLSIGVAP